MGSQRILPDLHALLDHVLHDAGQMFRSRPRFHWAGWLRWQQWLVLFAMGAAVIVIEVRSHTTMWQEHQSGQTLWTDPELLWECFLYGLVFPLLAGVVLGYVGRTAAERDDIARQLQQRRALVARMQEAQSWHELAELVVGVPGSIVSAERSWLLAQRPGEEDFDQVAYWEGADRGTLRSFPPVAPAVCEQCALASALQGTRVLACSHAGPANSAPGQSRYCLWLSSKESAKAVLLFDLPSDRGLDRQQRKVLEDLGDEMSMAIGNATLHEVKQRQVDVARSERLRIARDLHDTLGQNISYLRLGLEQLNSALLVGGRAEFQNELTKMLTVADEAYEQMRDALEELRATTHRDLEETLRLYAAKAGERAAFSVQIHSSGKPAPVSARKSRQMMYIVREAFNNVEKHAAAEHVEVHLQWSEAELRLTVCDDGRGFDSQRLGGENRYGMAIMQERSQAINAHLDIDSVPGEGTELTLILPLVSSPVTLTENR